MDSTKARFGQWIVLSPFWAVNSIEPILGGGFYRDPFWAVDSTEPILGSDFY